MTSFLLVDTQNLFHRASHVTRGDAEVRGALAIHIMLQSLVKARMDFQTDHIVFCLEHHSWRKSIYPKYKANRKESRDALSRREQEDQEILFEMLNEFISFLYEQTNCTVLRTENCEADDLIARWTQLHPDDQHVILSSDSDFKQLVSNNVVLYNGVDKKVFLKEDHHLLPIIEKDKNLKTEIIDDPEYILFEKCIRGDSSDNIFSAYPGVRKKGSKNKIGIQEAYADRHKKGFDWNNFMGQSWVDHEGKDHQVREDFQRNVNLICLFSQPEEIKKAMDNTIKMELSRDKRMKVGFHFARFCKNMNLVRASEQLNQISQILNAGYPGVE